jgi:hypothetical protein
MCLEVKTASTKERYERSPPHHEGGSGVRVCMEKVEGDVEATGGEGEGGGARPPCALPTPRRGGGEGCEGGSGLRRGRLVVVLRGRRRRWERRRGADGIAGRGEGGLEEGQTAAHWRRGARRHEGKAVVEMSIPSCVGRWREKRDPTHGMDRVTESGGAGAEGGRESASQKVRTTFCLHFILFRSKLLSVRSFT